MFAPYIHRLAAHPAMDALIARLSSAETVRAGALWGSSKSLAILALASRIPRPLLVVTATSHDAEDLYAELLLMCGGGASASPQSAGCCVSRASASAAPPARGEHKHPARRKQTPTAAAPAASAAATPHDLKTTLRGVLLFVNHFLMTEKAISCKINSALRRGV